MIDAIDAKFGLGQVVRHRDADFRGVVIDVDPVFPGDPAEISPVDPNQPFYQVLALGAEGGFVAYAPQDALEFDPELAAMTPDAERRWFNVDAHGRHAPRRQAIH